jgi:hypothetical protein
MCKGAVIPAADISAITVPYFGRQIKVAGTRTFGEWSPTIINDEDFAIRNAMEQWSNAINSFQGNLNNAGGTAPSLYKANAQVTQYGKTGDILRVYDFVGIFPTAVQEIALAWDQGDTIEEFSVTFNYDYWQVSGGQTGNAGGI